MIGNTDALGEMMAGGCSEDLVRLHEKKMEDHDRNFISLERSVSGIYKEMGALRVSVETTMREAVQTMIGGVAQDSREALTTAKSAHKRVDALAETMRDENKTTRSRLWEIGMRVAEMAAVIGILLLLVKEHML